MLPDAYSFLRFSFSGKDFRLKSYGVEVSIIDYTLSRLKKRKNIKQNC